MSARSERTGANGFPHEIERDGVLLRQWAAGDFEFYAAYLGSEATARYYGGAVDAQKAWRHLASVIGHWTLRGFGVYAVTLRGQLQGCAGLWEPHGWPCREFVYWFTEAAYAREGASKGARLALDLVKGAFSGEMITGFIHPENHQALSLARALGATLQGVEPLFDFGPHRRVLFFDPSSSRS